MKFLRTTLLALSLALLAAQPVAALVISDGSNGVLRPIADYTLDLSGSIVPQYSSIFIGAGIKLTVLMPTGGVFGNLLAGNQIVLGAGSQIIAGALNLMNGNVNLSGDVNLKSPSVLNRSGGGLNSGDISLSPGADLMLRTGPSGGVSPEPSTILLLPAGLILLVRALWRRAP